MALSNEKSYSMGKMNREISSDIIIQDYKVENYLISNNYYESKDVLNLSIIKLFYM